MKRCFAASAASAVLLAAMPAQAAVNLLTNGDFGAGDTGFTSEMSQGSVGIGPNLYIIGADPQSFNVAATSYGDNTSGDGLMMIVNGSLATDTVVWSQTVEVATGTDYDFSFWISTWFRTAPSKLDVLINGALVGQVTAPDMTGLWERMMFDWASEGATSAVIELVNTSTNFLGNDFALDDFSFSAPMPIGDPVPLPAAAWLFCTALAGGALARRKAARN